jgi:NAD(P)-dependent dehydrogenase (short-subunit alcohol dehydrogenase family)
MGPFDHLVYTAGDSVWQRSLGETKLEDAKAFFDVRFWGAFLVTKHASKLIRPDGSIVFTSSTVPRRPSVGFAIGASISSAVEAFAVAMAVELAPVRVNVVAPGIVRTPIWDRLTEEQREAFFAARALLCQLEGWVSLRTLPRLISALCEVDTRPVRSSS